MLLTRVESAELWRGQVWANKGTLKIPGIVGDGNAWYVRRQLVDGLWWWI